MIARLRCSDEEHQRQHAERRREFAWTTAAIIHACESVMTAPRRPAHCRVALVTCRVARKSPFKAEVYFFSVRQHLGQRWGTPAPITIRDKELGAMQIRMFGQFSYHLSDVQLFYKQVSGTRPSYSREELNQHFIGQIAGAA